MHSSSWRVRGGALHHGDGGRITLKPNTAVRLDQFRFAQDRPQEDAFAVRLLKGGLRAVYVSVSDGEIVVRNAHGELGLGAGQFGQIAREQRPLFLSTDPGLQFAPPATFIQSLLSGRQMAGIGEKLECAISAR